jgi:acyl-CoA reductase-like NAD-dependent aldehyde dehydrogenase
MATSTPPSASIGTGFRQMYVNGKWTDSSSGETFDVVNPVDRAVAAARAQFDGGEWSKMPGPQRRRLL